MSDEVSQLEDWTGRFLDQDPGHSASIARILARIDNANSSFGGYNPNHTTDRVPASRVPPTWEPRLPKIIHGRYVVDLELPGEP